MEKLRFGDKIKFEKKLEITDFKIPPLTIQPLVENAIKHGLLTPGKSGTVYLSTEVVDGEIQILIEDDGIGFETEVLKKENAVGFHCKRELCWESGQSTPQMANVLCYSLKLG